MLVSLVKNGMLCRDPVKRSILAVSSVYQTDRYKSNASHEKLPDNIQILKPVSQSSSTAALRVKTISKAMKAYLERSRSHEDFLKVKNEEFEIGRQHLANMMGLEVGDMSQNDIDKAIEYLLPSGLFEKKARPMMKPPIQLYPREKAAQFDVSGRPFSPFFYTGKSNFYEAVHELVTKFHELDAFEDSMIRKGICNPPEETALNLSGGDWFSKEEMQSMFLETLTDAEYDFLVTTLTRLGSHPYSFRSKDIIWKFRKKFPDLADEIIPELMTDENGRPYMEMIGNRKLCQAKVIVRGNGTGKVSINGTDIFYFERLQDREQIMYPLHFTGMLGLVDIEVDVSGVGESAQAGAIRLGLSLCLRSFVPELAEKMRLAGLLTRDRRRKGRKKPGQKGCRAKYTWKKR
ncbi:28S ribosomal protein S9, mitochondrial, partial [Stegodyphus mimosarum]